MIQSDRWHQELLEQMRTEIPGIRPAVINDNLYQPLRAYLGFRHVIRNNYTHRLEPKLIAQNQETQHSRPSYPRMIADLVGTFLLRPA